MRILQLLEGCVVVALLYAIATQVIIPALRGTMLFPWFRRERRLEAQIIEAEQRLHEQSLEQELTHLARQGTAQAGELMRQWRSGELQEAAIREELRKLYSQPEGDMK